MGIKFNFQQFQDWLTKSLKEEGVTSDCQKAITANAITIFNKANTTKQTNGSDEVLDTFEFQAVPAEIDEYIVTYETLQEKFPNDPNMVKLSTMFKDFNFERNGAKPNYFSIIVNNEKVVVGQRDDGSLHMIRGGMEEGIKKTENFQNLEELIQHINDSQNDFGKLGYTGFNMNELKLR